MLSNLGRFQTLVANAYLLQRHDSELNACFENEWHLDEEIAHFHLLAPNKSRLVWIQITNEFCTIKYL